MATERVMRPAASREDVWATGESYEPYVGRWSRLVATEFVARLDVPAGKSWLDIGCGTGALSRVILEQSDPEHVLGIDPSEGFLAFARRQVSGTQVEFRVGDAQAIPVQDASFDAVVSGLMLNFVPDPSRAVTEMRRTARREGIVAAYVWDYSEGMEMIRHFWNAVVALDPAAHEKDEGRRFPLCRAEPLHSLFEGVGLQEVGLVAIDVSTVFEDFDDYWTPFLGGQGPAPSYCASLAEDRRATLRETLRASLPMQHDGRVHLTARAWAVHGIA